MSGQEDGVAKLKGVKSVYLQKTVAEFFAGIGLMRLGLEREGWSVVFANDIASIGESKRN